MNKKDAYKNGIEFGYDAASWVDVPEVGDYISPCIDYVGLGKRVTADNVLEYFELLCYAAVDNSRQYTEFSFIASNINKCPNADYLWGAFEDGIYMGVCKRITEVEKSLF